MWIYGIMTPNGNISHFHWLTILLLPFQVKGLRVNLCENRKVLLHHKYYYILWDSHDITRKWPQHRLHTLYRLKKCFATGVGSSCSRRQHKNAWQSSSLALSLDSFIDEKLSSELGTINSHTSRYCHIHFLHRQMYLWFRWNIKCGINP